MPIGGLIQAILAENICAYLCLYLGSFWKTPFAVIEVEKYCLSDSINFLCGRFSRLITKEKGFCRRSLQMKMANQPSIT